MTEEEDFLAVRIGRGGRDKFEVDITDCDEDDPTVIPCSAAVYIDDDGVRHAVYALPMRVDGGFIIEAYAFRDGSRCGSVFIDLRSHEITA